jgi:hypothetical protein
MIVFLKKSIDIWSFRFSLAQPLTTISVMSNLIRIQRLCLSYKSEISPAYFPHSKSYKHLAFYAGMLHTLSIARSSIHVVYFERNLKLKCNGTVC